MVADHQGGEHQAGMRQAVTVRVVMAGLVPAIHVFLTHQTNKQDVDARDKRGHNG